MIPMFLLRTVAYAIIASAGQMLMEQLLLAWFSCIQSPEHAPCSYKKPTLSWFVMLRSSFVGTFSLALPSAVVAAWTNTYYKSFSWQLQLPNPILLGYWTLFTLLIHDCWSFFLHRWLHSNIFLFKHIHAKHHSPIAQLNVASAMHTTLLEHSLDFGLPIAAMYAASALFFGNWWYFAAAAYNTVFLDLVGHVGQDLVYDHLSDLLLPLANPFGVWQIGVPSHNLAGFHTLHHMHSRVNYSFFFSHWDDVFGSSTFTTPPCTALIFAAHAAWQAAYMFPLYLLFEGHLGHMIVLYILAYVMITPTAASAVVDALHLPQVFHKLFGWIQDVYREHNAITYAQPGTPGAFAALPQQHLQQGVGQTAVQQDDMCGLGKQQQPLYIFGCHPTGLFSRAAFQTFAARGCASPVSGLKGVRLAVDSLLMRLPLPFMREFLLLVGCCPADKATLVRQLQHGRSVAITPGGWRDTRYVATDQICLHKRKGFVALAAETGAQLVPVLCIGEANLCGIKWKSWMATYPLLALQLHWFISKRPKPLKVVFGQPLMQQPGETVDELHGRYVAALLALGKDHGITMTIAE